MTGADSASATPGCPSPSGTCWGRSSISDVRRVQVRILVDVLDRRQVRRPRPRVQVLQQAVVARAGVRLRDATFRIVEVAEDDRPRRADGLAGGKHVAIAHSLSPLFRLDASGVDAL